MTKLDLNDNGVTMSKLATISLLVVAIVTIGLLSIYAIANNDMNSHQQQVLAQ